MNLSEVVILSILAIGLIFGGVIYSFGALDNYAQDNPDLVGESNTTMYETFDQVNELKEDLESSSINEQTSSNIFLLIPQAFNMLLKMVTFIPATIGAILGMGMAQFGVILPDWFELLIGAIITIYVVLKVLSIVIGKDV